VRFHRHVWSVIAVKHGEYVILGGMGTHILKRCSVCSKTRVETMNGVWTVSQITGVELK